MSRLLGVFLFVVALLLLGAGTYVGLAVAPVDQDMGNVYRIMFVHVPSAWVALLAYTVTLVSSLVYLFRGSWVADGIAEASAEVGVIFNGLLLITGSIWGRPTWGVWWTWDPRLTTAAVMMSAFVGYLALRRFSDTPERRATWAAVVAIIVYMDIPLVWFSVRWWNSIHQVQTTARSMPDPMMRTALVMNALGLILLYVAFVRARYSIARALQALDNLEPPADTVVTTANAGTGGKS
jgi:heme exporter protein C